MKNNKKINISFNQAMSMINQYDDVLLIDVKSKEEYEKFHIGNSINIPIEKFKRTAPRYIKNKNQKIIIYCSSGIRSLAACEILRDMGYREVYNIYGGIE